MSQVNTTFFSSSEAFIGKYKSDINSIKRLLPTETSFKFWPCSTRNQWRMLSDAEQDLIYFATYRYGLGLVDLAEWFSAV